MENYYLKPYISPGFQGIPYTIFPQDFSQDSDESESDAFAYLFEANRSPIKRKSLKLTESSEDSSSLTRCFEGLSQLCSNVGSLFRIPVYRYLLFGTHLIV